MVSDKTLRRDFQNREELEQYIREEFSEAVSADGKLASIRGGERVAREALLGFRPARYQNTRNFLSGNVSRLSAYIRHGVVTLSEVLLAVISQPGGFQAHYKFIQELAWRDYWQRLYFELGSGIWLDREEWKTGWQADEYADSMPRDVLNAQTQLACMDAFLASLVAEGYLHNHARMWFAAYLVHWRRVKWQAGARWFLTHLLDGDPASNNLSWQWVASTFSSKPYIFNRENLEHYTEGIYCAGCARRDSCPFDKPYSELSSELFRE